MRVRLRGDPTRMGIITGLTRPGRRDKGYRYQVKFADSTIWVPDDQIEPLPAERETPLDLLEKGRIGRALDFRRTLIHVRLTGRLADVIYSMEATNTDFYPYQFKPVLRFLSSPSNAILIADEVGLGKTIEAGLIWTELRSRFDLRRLLVLCPAILKDKWQRELANKFGIRAENVSAEQLLRRLETPDALDDGFALIASLEGTRPHRDWSNDDDGGTPSATDALARLLESKENETPLIDLLIIDEAHYLRNPESQTNLLGRLCRAVSEHLVMLTATPIHNYNRDLFTLLRLLDADTFEREGDLGLILDASRPLVRARDRVLDSRSSRDEILDLLREAEAHPLLHGNRQLVHIQDRIGARKHLDDHQERADLARRLELVNPLAYVITRTRKRDVNQWRVVRHPQPEAVVMTPAEESCYTAVTKCVIAYAMRRAVNERFVLATPQRQLSSSMAATLRAWQRQGDNVDDVAAAEGKEGEPPDIGPLKAELLRRANDFGDVAELTRNDSKYSRLRTILQHFFGAHPSERVVLFSTYRETLNYLSDRLSEDQISNVVMHGGVKESKEEILARFERADSGIRVLLSSEVGSEGIDLQFCRVLINYDLPWNPMRVEQRIGRLDRIGQRADRILIWNLLYSDTIDERIFTRLFEKLDLCRQALGDFEAVVGDEIRRLTIDLLSDHLTADQQERRIDQTAQALATLRLEQEQLEGEAAHLVAYGDYILNQVYAAKEMNRVITGDDLRAYVIDFFSLHYTGCVFRQAEEGSLDFDVKLTPAAKQDLDTFMRERRLAYPTAVLRNTSRPVRCRFGNRVIGTLANEPVEYISQFHPLVRFVSTQITARAEQLSPAVSIGIPYDSLPAECATCGDYLLAIARWSLDGLQAVEKLAYAAARVGSDQVMSPMASEKLASACAQYGTDWFEGPRVVDLKAAAEQADQQLFGQLDEQFDVFVEDIRRQNEDRADLQLRTLERHLDNQNRKLAAVLERHRFHERQSLVKATEGRMEALANRVARQKMAIQERRRLRYRSDEILLALVRVCGND